MPAGAAATASSSGEQQRQVLADLLLEKSHSMINASLKKSSGEVTNKGETVIVKKESEQIV